MGSKDYNKELYENLWSSSKLLSHVHSHRWPILKKMCRGDLLEIGPGMRPSIPIKGSFFIELSNVAARKIGKKGGKVLGQNELGTGKKFDLICAFEVLEHIEEDKKILSSIKKSLKKDGLFCFSVPVFEKKWCNWDVFSGHVRRYEPIDLEKKLRSCGLKVVAFANDNSARACFDGIKGDLIRFLIEKLPSLSMKAYDFLYVAYGKFSKSSLKLKKDNLKNMPHSTLGVFVVCQKA